MNDDMGCTCLRQQPNNTKQTSSFPHTILNITQVSIQHDVHISIKSKVYLEHNILVSMIVPEPFKIEWNIKANKSFSKAIVKLNFVDADFPQSFTCYEDHVDVMDECRKKPTTYTPNFHQYSKPPRRKRYSFVYEKYFVNPDQKNFKPFEKLKLPPITESVFSTHNEIQNMKNPLANAATTYVGLTAHRKRNVITSPNYPQPYGDAYSLEWNILADSSIQNAIVHIKVLDSELSNIFNCYEDIIEIMDDMTPFRAVNMTSLHWILLVISMIIFTSFIGGCIFLVVVEIDYRERDEEEKSKWVTIYDNPPDYVLPTEGDAIPIKIENESPTKRKTKKDHIKEIKPKAQPDLKSDDKKLPPLRIIRPTMNIKQWKTLLTREDNNT
ncbi:CUBN [Mytilus edulis]|uniref:CUBN n=1 Tax=Mytilus edulis TaxID=6550 RepID=A0A8S3UM92_MYTED|nr:CUBN [Mytilus edulis]